MLITPDFDAATHTYRVSGIRVPNVTGILKATGVATDFDELADIYPRIGQAIAVKRTIGTAVHADAHAYDDHDLDLADVHPLVLPYLNGWIAFRGAHGELTPMARERRVFEPCYHFAGTFDALMRAPDGSYVLIDIKCGDPEAAAANYQLAAYAMALNPMTGVVPVSRWCVRLTNDGGYRVTVYDDPNDLFTWLSIVTTFYAGAARRREYPRAA